MNLDFNAIKKVYVIGIKGSGIIGIVEILHSRGIEIIGSDTDEKFFTNEILDRLGIPYFEKFDPKNIPADVDLIIYSTAYNENNNTEFRSAKEKNMPMVSYPEILAGLFNAKYGIAVAGTHGKTTTSAMLASAIKNCGKDPIAAVGGKVKEWDGNSLAGNGEMFILEADEYQNKLNLYEPKAVVLTSCDFDHPDFFKDFEEYKRTFKEFVAKIPKAGFLVVWGDSVDTLEVSNEAKSKILTYGFNEENDVTIEIIETKIQEEIAEKLNIKKEKLQTFEVFHGKQSLGKFETPLLGRHNILNSTAVITACYILNLNLEKVGEAIRNFKGTSRRFEYIGEYKGAILIDDYGHHPEEIKPTLRAAREAYPEKIIWAVFHPHTFTRTKALLSEFAQSFGDADKVIVLDIYGSAREVQGGVHSQELVDMINKYDFNKAKHLPGIKDAVKFLRGELNKNDLVIAIGAGNVWEVVEKLSAKGAISSGRQ
ncbi:MAG TPA: UDP-N-acetylmuramate--L-alanine ligase, partial [Patescibacteria group bacterium]|nr:UDP-N-acetylmuramate--L-alanine ligase [Patescibacteria group bacterium]